MFSFSKNYSLICIHAGKIIGGFCALSGVFILTLPIPIVVNTDFQYTNSGKLQYQHLTLVNSDWILCMGPKTQISTLGIYDSTTKVEWTKVWREWRFSSGEAYMPIYIVNEGRRPLTIPGPTHSWVKWPQRARQSQAHQEKINFVDIVIHLVGIWLAGDGGWSQSWEFGPTGRPWSWSDLSKKIIGVLALFRPF